MSETDGSKEDRDRLWKVDPGIYKPASKQNILQRFGWSLRSIGPLLLLAGFLAYPLAIAILGVVYGGLVFWGLFGGSLVIIWLVLTKAGLARNFEAWDPDLSMKLAGLTIAFLGVVGFFLGLFWLGLWLLPLLGAVMISILVLTIKKRG